MDLNGDGCIDILSGSYSREGRDMAGLFQVLWGKKDKTFQKPTALAGSNGEPLLLPAGTGDDDVIDKICTRPFAADLDGDGKLDLVSGNFRGTFAFFKGEGDGKFAPAATWLEADGSPMLVDAHSDPFLVDWDKDGDLDLLSGSAHGGVFLFTNIGTKTAPKFAARTTLLEQAGHGDANGMKFGDAHCTGPAADTRVWADDVDGDGKLDLLVGDMITLHHLPKGVTEAAAQKELVAWQKEQQKLFETEQGDDEASQKRWQDAYKKLEKKREKFMQDEMTGFVWLLRQK